MRLTYLALIISFWICPASAFEIEDSRTYQGAKGGQILRVLSTADMSQAAQNL